MAFAATLQPFYNAAGAYSATGDFAEGLQTPMFNATLGMGAQTSRVEAWVMCCADAAV